MILKLLIDFYRWLWNLPPFDTTDATMGLILFFGALLDILAIVWIVVSAVVAYNNRQQERRRG